MAFIEVEVGWPSGLEDCEGGELGVVVVERFEDEVDVGMIRGLKTIRIVNAGQSFMKIFKHNVEIII